MKTSIGDNYRSLDTDHNFGKIWEIFEYFRKCRNRKVWSNRIAYRTCL